MRFVPTASDSYLYTWGTNIILLYVDDCILISKTKADVEQLYKSIEKRGYSMTDEGSMEQYLGMKIDKYNNDSFQVSQPFLIQRIIDAIPSMKDATSAKSPAATGTVLTKDEEGES